MANENEVRKIVKMFRENGAPASIEEYSAASDSLNVLLALAEQWLAVKGLPSKTFCGLHPNNESLACNNCADGRIKNAVISACRLAVAKGYVPKDRLLTQEETEKAVFKANLLVEQGHCANGCRECAKGVAQEVLAAQQEKMEGK